MKKLICILTLLTFLSTAFTQDDEVFMSKTFNASAVKNVDSKTSGGSILVESTTSSQARVDVYIRSSNWKKRRLSDEEIRERLDEYELTVDLDGNTLVATARKKSRLNWRDGLSISFEIFVPAEVNTDLNTSGGSISITGLRGDQDFRTSGGSLKVDNVAGNIDGSTSGGSISVTRSHENIDLNTSGGSIDAEDCSGDIELTTSGGSIHLEELSGKVKANTSGGSIRGNDISAELNVHTSGGSISLDRLRGSVDASTSGGHIDVEIQELGDYVELSNSGGSINLSLPMSQGLDLDLKGSKISTGTLSNFSGSVDDDYINGKLNGGGVPVKIRANSGRVRLNAIN